MDLQYINLYEEYANFASNYFEYLKGNILKDFPSLQLNIRYITSDVHAIAQNTFNSVSLYMYELDQTYFTNKCYIKNTILYALTHEAIHQLQMVDRYKYMSNRNYANYIEKNCDYTTMMFINENNKELQIYTDMIVYEYNIDTLNGAYNNDKNSFIIDRKNIDIKYLYNLVCKFMCLPEIEVYNHYILFDNIYFQFYIRDSKTNEEQSITCKIMDENVFSMEIFEYIFNTFLIRGYQQRMEKAFVVADSHDIIYEIHMNNNPIKIMERI